VEEPSEIDQRRSRSRIPKWAFVGLVDVLSMCVLPISVFFLLTGDLPLAGGPSNCEELVKHLRAKGLNVDSTPWPEECLTVRNHHHGPAIGIFDKDRADRAAKATGDDVKKELGGMHVDAKSIVEHFDATLRYPANTVFVVPYYTAREARAEASIRSDAYNYGKFLLYSDDVELMKQIKRKL
jgi:hypothetical protein